ncbi:Protein of unknown function [Fibrobacter intestinalis]|uniref:DUF3800 domain-containing protein n=3 Tax=Fibrobacteraceae TaxID=204431 RepID=A0A1M6PLS7_9BACT|nr:DUF3800 domain-containing protein [Fibrobacter intestinalis]PBC69008.1 uncharacterized protein DUF3800 [Fibrobacter sp. UWS1]SHK08797.1 Protein of unknown function [Fibrobacter intestinalis]
MYLLYVDDSGLATDKNCKHCVLAGLAIRDTKTFYVQQDIERILAKHPDCKNLELHGTRMRSGKGEWRSIPKETREGLLKEILGYIAAHYPNYFILFGAVLDKTCQIDVAHDEELFTQITSRFDMFLKRRFAKKQVPERGIAIFDKSTSEQKFQQWSQAFQIEGNHWGNTLVNFAEVPLFLDSKMSRLIQLADLVAYALFRKYEFGDDSYSSIIQGCFDKDKGQEYGLYIR